MKKEALMIKLNRFGGGESPYPTSKPEGYEGPLQWRSGPNRVTDEEILRNMPEGEGWWYDRMTNRYSRGFGSAQSALEEQRTSTDSRAHDLRLAEESAAEQQRITKPIAQVFGATAAMLANPTQVGTGYVLGGAFGDASNNYQNERLAERRAALERDQAAERAAAGEEAPARTRSLGGPAEPPPDTPRVAAPRLGSGPAGTERGEQTTMPEYVDTPSWENLHDIPLYKEDEIAQREATRREQLKGARERAASETYKLQDSKAIRDRMGGGLAIALNDIGEALMRSRGQQGAGYKGFEVGKEKQRQYEQLETKLGEARQQDVEAMQQFEDQSFQDRMRRIAEQARSTMDVEGRNRQGQMAADSARATNRNNYNLATAQMSQADRQFYAGIRNSRDLAQAQMDLSAQLANQQLSAAERQAALDRQHQLDMVTWQSEISQEAKEKLLDWYEGLSSQARKDLISLNTNTTEGQRQFQAVAQGIGVASDVFMTYMRLKKFGF